MRITEDEIVEHARSAMTREPAAQIAALLGAADDARTANRMTSLVEGLSKAMAEFAAAAQAATLRVQEVMFPFLMRERRRIDPRFDLMVRRWDRGGMVDDAVQWPDHWQSTICAGLLCSIAPCPSDEHDLRCTCRCHR